MSEKSKQKNKSFWERTAKFYTKVQEQRNGELYALLTEKITPYLSSEMSVLELGCGAGQLSLPLASQVKEFIATDFSESMIKEAKKRARPENLKFAVQDATKLAYPDNKFDCVIIANTLHIMPEPEKALAESRRVLKKAGLLIAPTFVQEGKINKLQLWLMERIGFKTFHNWNLAEFLDFIEKQGFTVLQQELIASSPTAECFLVAQSQVSPISSR